jgi:alanine racemase
MKNWIELNSENLRHNLSVFKNLAKEKKILFTVKANAYGHGLREIVGITKDMDSFDYYGVDSLSEALEVKKIDEGKNILILGWLDDEDLPEAIKHGIEFVIPSIEFLLRAEDAGSGSELKGLAHLKVETGTSRLGIRPEELLEFFKTNQLNNIKIKGIYSHFANIEDTTDHTFAMEQLNKFHKLLKEFKSEGLIRHFSCSASALLFPETYFDMVRVGISAYGFWPSKQTYVSFTEKNGKKVELKPVLSLKSRVAQVKKLDIGTPVSYGLTYKTFVKSVMAVIPVGYYDGYDRKLSNVSNVLINGKAAPVRGRICMNMFIADVTHIKSVVEGDVVTIIGKDAGEDILVDDLAELAGTINYEFVSRLNPLLPRIII